MDAWEETQHQTFCSWANTHMDQDKQLPDLNNGLKNGEALIRLLERLSGKKMPTEPVKKPKFKIHHIQNNNVALDFLQSQGIKLVNVSAVDIADGKIKPILGLMWTLILRYQINKQKFVPVERVVKARTQQAPPATDASSELLEWVRNQLKDYSISVSDFTSSWKSGIALAALVHSIKKSAIDFDKLDKTNPLTLNKVAVAAAEKHLSIPPLINPEVVTKNPEKLSVMTYLSYFRDKMNSTSSIEEPVPEPVAPVKQVVPVKPVTPVEPIKPVQPAKPLVEPVKIEPAPKPAPENNSSVFGWGLNNKNQLGLGKTGSLSEPVEITSLQKKNIISIQGGYLFSIAQDKDYQVYSFGGSEYGQSGQGNNSDCPTPLLIHAFKDHKIIQVAVGFSHAMALNDQGQVYSWGYNALGQLGLGDDKENKSVPHLIPIEDKIKHIAAGANHSLVLCESGGTIISFGDNEHGQCGTGETAESIVPTAIATLSDMSLVFANYCTSYALDQSSNVLVAFGNNDYGQCSTGDFKTPIAIPQVIAFFKDIKIAHLFTGANAYHVFVMSDKKAVYGWGLDSYAQIGLGKQMDRLHTPTLIDTLSDLGSPVSHIACANNHSLALTEQGNLWSVGYNKNGECGLGDTEDTVEWTEVLDLPKVVAIGTGFLHSFICTQ